MNTLANVIFVLAGVFLAGFTAVIARHSRPQDQSLLLSVALAGALLIYMRIPLAPGLVGILPSGGYAILAAGFVIASLLRELRIDGARCPAPKGVGLATSTSILTVAVVMWWVAIHAP